MNTKQSVTRYTRRINREGPNKSGLVCYTCGTVVTKVYRRSDGYFDCKDCLKPDSIRERLKLIWFKMKVKMTNRQKDFEPCPAQKDFDQWREAKENPCLIMRQTVIVKIEPSKRLSQLCGFPYFIERRYMIGELLEMGMITEQDIEHMKSGGEIMKTWRTKI